MRNRLLAALFAVAIIGLGYWYFKPRCVEATQIDVNLAQIYCLQSLTPDDIKQVTEQACLKKTGNVECDLDPATDEELVLGLLRDKINNCVDAALKEKNICTDKVEKL